MTGGHWWFVLNGTSLAVMIANLLVAAWLGRLVRTAMLLQRLMRDTAATCIMNAVQQRLAPIAHLLAPYHIVIEPNLDRREETER